VELRISLGVTAMKYGSVPGVEKPFARLILGSMIVTSNERDTSFCLLDDALELGFTAIDTAHIYAGGDSERCIGAWMQERGNRDEMVVVSKGSHPNADRKRVTPYDIGADLLDTLARLKSDYVDCYLLHRDDTDVPVGEIVDALDEHRRAGRIHSYGGSNWTHGRIAAANEYAAKNGRAPFVASSPNYSLAEQVKDPWGDNSGSVTLSGPENADARSWYAETQLPVLAWSSIARGFFSGRFSRADFEQKKDLLDGAASRAYIHERNFERLDRVEALAGERGVTVPQIAMAYVLTDPMNVYAIVGAADRSEMIANIEALEVKLSGAEREWLNLERNDR
jgi:aryl-alcohol dehydrogenase-like predicted oxidoreductase